jgi:endonuclease G
MMRKVSWSNPSVAGIFPAGNFAKMVLTRYHHDNGDSCLLVIIRKGNYPAILSGVWTLFIESKGIPLGGGVHAWLERDDWSSVQFRNHMEPDVTLTIPGTARSVICVSAVDTTGGPKAIGTPKYSAYGGTRDDRNKPELAAPGQDIPVAQDGTTDGVISSSGTSMAAPHVSGAIALLMSLWAKKNYGKEHLTANQIRAALTQGAQDFNPMWNEKRGYGILDVETLLESFM